VAERLTLWLSWHAEHAQTVLVPMCGLVSKLTLVQRASCLFVGVREPSHEVGVDRRRETGRPVTGQLKFGGGWHQEIVLERILDSAPKGVKGAITNCIV
jgi:hypothetical protein